MPDSTVFPQSVMLLGASGKIGLEIRKALHQLAPATIVYCCSRQAYSGSQFPQEQWLQFDPFSASWPEVGGVEVLINAVGAIQETAEASFEKVHVGLTQRMLAQRASLRQPRIVQVSALGAARDAGPSFLRTKGEADALLLTMPETTVLRPSIVCTPDTMLSLKLRQLLKIARFSFGKMLVPNGFEATRTQPILGSDVGLAVAYAALHGTAAPIVELVGPEQLSFGTLLHEMAATQGRPIKLLAVSREIVDGFVKHFVSVWFPGLIHYEQFQLLFQDNVGDVQATAALLGRMPISTIPFWREEAAIEAVARPEAESLALD